MSALEMSSSEGTRTNSKNLKCSFQSFKVSRFQICGDKVTWGISTFEMLAFKTPSVECKDKAKISGFNVTLRRKLCYNILIYFINLSNLWQLAAHWDSWNVLCCFGKVWSVWHWQIYVDLILNCGSTHGSLYRW